MSFKPEPTPLSFKPEVGQSLRWEFAMRVARTFSLSTEDAMRLLEMVKNYDKERGEFLASAQQPAPAMDDATFDRMTDEFQALVSLTDEELRLLLENTGLPPASNKLYAVMDNMRRVFGSDQVKRWLEECGKRGILT